MCQDCPTAQKTAKAVGRELLADVLLPFLVYGIALGAVIASGVWHPF